jgi:NADPH:quinone reductase-like Zn-dependent oxidoreductase
MKGVVFEKFGPSEVLQVKTDLPKPQRKPFECLVRLASTSVNPVDWKTRKGEVPHFMVKLPNVSVFAGISFQGRYKYFFKI